MINIFAIDFIRQALEQTFLKEHIDNVNLFGGKDQVSILSFYEQLKSQDEVNRFVETYRDLADQQNRTGLILNGVLVSPENPTITNLYSSLIVPMSWTCSLRSTLGNRDQAIVTINNLIEKLKGRKVDIAQLKCNDENGKDYYTPFVVGTIGQGNGAPILKNGDYIGSITNVSQVKTILNNLSLKGMSVSDDILYWLYVENENKIKVVKATFIEGQSVIDGLDDPYVQDGNLIYIDIVLDNEYNINKLYQPISGSFYIEGTDDYAIVELNNGVIFSSRVENSKTVITVKFELEKPVDEYIESAFERVNYDDIDVYLNDTSYSFVENDGSHNDIVFPPEHESFEKYKLSMSFDAIRCDEPRNLNGDEYCELSFGGQATLVNHTAKLGNDLLKVGIKRDKVIKKTGTTTFADTYEYLEPLEMPSGSNANTKINQLISNNFKTNTHTDGLALSLQYTFIVDDSSILLTNLFDYARYGEQTYITPNIIYSVKEIWCYWGDLKVKTIPTKLVETTEIDNTESDVLSLSLNMQIQGENN